MNDADTYFIEKITGIISQANNPSLQIDLIDLKIAETDQKDGCVEMKMMASTGGESSINYTLFPLNDDWYWGQYKGLCGNNQGGNEEIDAADLLEYQSNHFKLQKYGYDDGFYCNIFNNC